MAESGVFFRPFPADCCISFGLLYLASFTASPMKGSNSQIMKRLDKRRALVLFSGGQDSTIVLALALTSYDHVETIGFDYGQRHKVELQCREDVLHQLAKTFPDHIDRLGMDHMLDLTSFAAISQSALTDEKEEIMETVGALPTSFVPGRNLFFFSYAAVIGYNRGLGTLVGGMCETDYSGYPDCRAETLAALEATLNLGMETDFQISTPLMHLSKGESWKLALESGGEELVELIRTSTHSCYNGKRELLHDWGYGCGACPACQLRARGYADFLRMLA